MKTNYCFPLVIFGLLFLGSSLPAQEGVLPVKLEPNTVPNFKFAELPETFLAKKTRKKGPAQISAQLPSNYTGTGNCPLFVFLEGGDGSAGDQLEKTREIIGPKILLP